MIGFVIFTLTISEIQGRKLFKCYAKFYFLQKVFFVIISLTLFQFIGSEGILLGYGLSFMLFFKQMYLSIKRKNYNFKFLKEKSGFIANNYSLDIAGSIKGQIDKLMIAPMFGFALLGNYYLGSGYEKSSEYKANYKGFEWWTGAEWSKNKRLYRRLCRRDSTIENFSALGNLSLISNKT